MNYSLNYSGPTVLGRAVKVLAALALFAWSGAALGQNVVRVEEDWSLEIGANLVSRRHFDPSLDGRNPQCQLRSRRSHGHADQQ